jgi:glutaredoxin
MDREKDTDLTLFTSSHCAPCEMMKRKLDALKKEMPFSMKIVNIDGADKASLQGFRMAPVIKLKDEVVVGEVDLEDLRCALMRNLYSRV